MNNKRKVESGGLKKVIMLFSMSFLAHQGRYLRVYNEAKTLVDAGKDVTLIAWDRDCKEAQNEILDGIKIERIWSQAGFQRGPANIFAMLAFYAKVLLKLFKKDVDVIHCFNLDTILPGLLVAKLKGKKAVLDLCEPDYYASWPSIFRPLVILIQAFERFFSRRFDYVLVHNTYQMKKFSSYGITALEQIGSYPNRSLIIDKIGIKKSDNGVAIGRFGSIYRNNGIEEMIDAFKILRESFPSVRLILAGKVFEEFEQEFVRLIAPLGEAVKILGEYSPQELPDLYRKIDISLQLTRKTAWFKNITPTKFFESLANAVPVVTSEIGDLRDIIDAHNCGVIVDETDPRSVCKGLRKLVEDSNLRFEMTQNALKGVQLKFNWDLMGKRLLKLYQVMASLNTQICKPESFEAKKC